VMAIVSGSPPCDPASSQVAVAVIHNRHNYGVVAVAPRAPKRERSPGRLPVRGIVQPRPLHSTAPNRGFSLPARPFSFVMRPNQRMVPELGLASQTRGSALVTARVGEPDLVGADRVVLLRDDHDKLPARVILADHPGHGLSSLSL
jgi:hypothetical protein